MTRTRLSLLAMLLLAFLLRVLNLNGRALWYDEAFAVLFSEKGLNAMLYGTLTPAGGAAADVHPLLYYTSLDGWMRRRNALNFDFGDLDRNAVFQSSQARSRLRRQPFQRKLSIRHRKNQPRLGIAGGVRRASDHG